MSFLFTIQDLRAKLVVERHISGSQECCVTLDKYLTAEIIQRKREKHWSM